MCSKLRRGSGVGSCHSIERTCHGLAGAVLKLKNHDQMMLMANSTIDAKSREAQNETQSLRFCNDGAYVDTRRGMSSIPAANSGVNARLKLMNIHQKWILPILSLSIFPIILGNQ